MNKTIFLSMLFGTLLFLSSSLINGADAQVVVKPNEVGIKTTHIFTINVVNEKSQPITELKLLVPKNLEYVTPTVKNGWIITTEKVGEVIQSIEWAGGAVSAGQRDEFTFSAKVPDKTTTLLWRVYQTYQDGTIVSWDREPLEKQDNNEKLNSDHYSTTLVVDNILKPEIKQTMIGLQQSDLPLLLSGLAVIFAALALIVAFSNLRKNRKGR